jgi:hypothetical protein
MYTLIHAFIHIHTFIDTHTVRPIKLAFEVLQIAKVFKVGFVNVLELLFKPIVFFLECGPKIEWLLDLHLNLRKFVNAYI